jgi:hypothetical protein
MTGCNAVNHMPINNFVVMYRNIAKAHDFFQVQSQLWTMHMGLRQYVKGLPHGVDGVSSLLCQRFDEF